MIAVPYVEGGKSWKKNNTVNTNNDISTKPEKLKPNDYGLIHINTLMPMAGETLKTLSTNKKHMSGISTGYKDIDRLTSGFAPANCVILAARPGMGKSTLALNIAANVSKDPSKAVIYFSLEMSAMELALRLISSEGSIDHQKLQNGILDKGMWAKAAVAMTSLSSRNLYLSENMMSTVDDIKTACRSVDNLGLVVIDYLQLINSAGKVSAGGVRQQVISDISRAIKIMAGELKVPILCLSQLSRSTEYRQDKRPILSDLRDSGAIEQDADIVMFLYDEEYYTRSTGSTRNVECIVAKQRSGAKGTAMLRWTQHYSRFDNAPENEPEIEYGLPFEDSDEEGGEVGGSQAGKSDQSDEISQSEQSSALKDVQQVKLPDFPADPDLSCQAKSLNISSYYSRIRT